MPKKPTTGRIVYPRSPGDSLDLSASVYKKHLADGTKSDLNNMDGYDWATTGPTIVTAQALDKKANELKAQMEEAFSQRDQLMKPISEITRASGRYLKGKFSKNPKKLGEWGFVVDDTPPAPKKPQKKEG